MSDKKAPYYLLIHTDSYTGNFERELVAYCIGILDDEQENYAKAYSKAFWNRVGASDIDSLEEYNKAESRYTSTFSGAIDDILASLSDSSLKEFNDKKEKRKQEAYNNDIRRLYDTYLCYTHQEVDDWEQDTFYNIESFYKNKEYNCDTIFIQLNNILPEKIERIVIGRIIEFFENEVFSYIENYEWICQFGRPKGKNESYKLLDLELVDSDYNLIKKYSIEEVDY